MVRLSERLIAAYLVYTSALSLALPLTSGQRLQVLAANVSVLGAYALLWRFRAAWTSVVRDWAPLAVMIVCYHEMGWFAHPIADHYLERTWLAWDHTLLYGWGLKAAVESAGAAMPWLLELSYLLVYALPPFMMAMIYGYGRRKHADEFLTIYILGLCFAYGQFPFWPSEPPRTVFAGQDLPVLITPIRRLTIWMLSSQGIHTSVFPSAHVSGAVAAAFAARRIFCDKPWLRRAVPIYAGLVATATVYGRYHYAADAVAGAAVAVMAYAVAMVLLRRSSSISGARCK